MKLAIPAALSVAVLAGCVAPPLEEYRPVVDPAKSGARYESDLAACRKIAEQAEAEYRQRQNEQLGANIVAGLIVGAAIGAAYGNSDWAASGAAYGAAAGVAATDTELAYGGPRRIVDRCMEGRGHRVLSDLGAG